MLQNFPALKGWPNRAWNQFYVRFNDLSLRVLFTRRQYKLIDLMEHIIRFKHSKCFKTFPALKGWPNRTWNQFYARFHDLSLRVRFTRRQYKHIDIAEHIMFFKPSKCSKPFPAHNRWPDRTWIQFYARFPDVLLWLFFTRRQYKQIDLMEHIICFKPSKWFKTFPALNRWPNRA